MRFFMMEGKQIEKRIESNLVTFELELTAVEKRHLQVKILKPLMGKFLFVGKVD